MSFTCPVCAHPSPHGHLEEQPPDADRRHRFEFAVTVQGADADWVGEPFRLTVRAWSLAEACGTAMVTPLHEWTQPAEEDP